MRMKMKKYLFPIVALLALAACSKVTPVSVDEAQREVTFVVADYAQTKADGGKYDTKATFGTYAWLYTTTMDGPTVTEWMVNEPVGYKDPVWKTTEAVFYWPKSTDLPADDPNAGSADFISYSPFAGTAHVRPAAPTADQGETVGREDGAAPAAGQGEEEEGEEVLPPEPVITRTVKDDKSVAYTFEYASEDAPYRVNGSKYDLMYADWKNARGNVDQIKDGDRDDSAYKGVPTLFRHALACISFQIRANFITYTDQQTGETTDWEVTLQEAVLENLYHSGWRKLELGADKKWNYPGDPADSGVWRNNREVENLTLYQLPTPEAGEETGADGGQDDTQGDAQGEEQGDARAPGLPLTKDPVTLLSDYFVLPQILETSYPDNRIYAQRLRLKVHIKTLQPNGFPFTEEFNTVLDLSKLMNDAGLNNAWKMNQKFIYKISIMPTARGEEPTITPPDNPSEVKIFFDPAVDGWQTSELDATIML